MKMPKIYLDNCCFNRPYDDQEQTKIKIETEAKIAIQEQIKNGECVLAWSYILDYENSKNPMIERSIEISRWKNLSLDDVEENLEIIDNMNIFINKGLKPLDALHISCAVNMRCDYFITVDKGILNKKDVIDAIAILSPIDFVK